MRELLQQKQTAGVVALLLSVALVVTMLAPLGGFKAAEPQNPFREADILPIESVDLGVVADGSLGEVIQSASSQSGGSSGSEGQTDGETEDPQQEAEQPAQPEQQQTEENPKEQPASQPQQPQENSVGEQVSADEGEEGGEEVQPQLGLVLTWYKYGTQASTVVCSPGSAVGRTIRDTQLDEGQLRYHLELTGEDSSEAEITEVRFGYLDAAGERVSDSGTVELQLPQGQTEIRYGFTVTALWQTQDTDSQPVEQELEFQIAIYYESGLDLELNLNWTDKDGKSSAVRCMADKSAAFTVKRSWLAQDVLPYTLELVGESAKEAELVSAAWSSDSGQSGELEQSGQWQLQQPEGDQTRYTLRVEVRVDERPVTFVYTMDYENNLDLRLNFTWYEGGLTGKTLTCEANESAAVSIKRSQLSGDQLQYKLELTGESAANASILSAQLSPGGNLSIPSGSVFLSLPEDGSKAKYTLTVKARTGGDEGQNVTFTVPITYTGDVRLQLHYEAAVEGVTQRFTVTCDNGKTRQASVLYDDQLTDGMLPYTLELTGEDAAGLTITEVSCYQSGSGKTLSLSQPTGSVQLLTDGKKTGENTVTVKAQDAAGTAYQFKVQFPYQHRGENTVKITTNLTEGEVVANESEITLLVEAWSEEADGSVKEHILASGVDTELVVQLDGKTCTCTGISGYGQQYTLIPENPAEGDTNQHVLTIRAVDSEGNWGEYTVNFTGERSMTAQKIGTATIYVDMGVLGLGSYGSISYDVLKDEPVSYVVAKALWGYEDETFGAAEHSFGWPAGSYTGSFDRKFYLTRVANGENLAARAQAISSWDSLGSTQEEILAGIDETFGAGTGLAILWRCIYMSGMNLSGGQSDPYAIGEFDYTSGSGWLYAVGGSYPGSAMSDYYLKDGDTLTLRFTLAKGADVVGGGSASYCVQWTGSGFTTPQHSWQEGSDGMKVCSVCGLRSECEHQHTEYQDQGDGTCGLYCEDCQKLIQQPADHDYEITVKAGDEDNHALVCKNCQHEESEAHVWQKTGSTVTCEHGGEITYTCERCGDTKTETRSEPNDHEAAGEWQADSSGHYQICKNCQGKVNESAHDYAPDGDDWYCTVCYYTHSEVCGANSLSLVSEATCQKGAVYQCGKCGETFTTEERGECRYENGKCIDCGTPDYSAPGGEDGDGEDGDGKDGDGESGGDTDYGGDTGQSDPELTQDYSLNALQLQTQRLPEYGSKYRRNHHGAS